MIYATAYKMSDLRHPGESVDSGFSTIDEAVTMLGASYIRKTARYVIYGGDEDRVVFSDFPFRLIRIDERTNNE